ncbi:MAG: AAA family ATPase, partial [Fibrella sp.]|nr:AAA family ATPase [Armatimonadota bacterium]
MRSNTFDKYWRVELFGGLRLSHRSTELTRFQTHKSAALLAYLTIHNHNATSRDILAELFWSDAEPEAQRNSLRVALNSLRRQLEPPDLASGAMLIADRTTVRLNPDVFSTDVAEFETGLKQEERLARANAPRTERIAILQSAVDLYHGPVLAGWYEDWAILEQNRLSDSYANAMRRLATILLEAQQHDAAIETARRSIAVDPMREESHRLLIRIYSALGRQTDALLQYRELEAILHDQFGVKPSPATRDLLSSPASIPAIVPIALPEIAPFPQIVVTQCPVEEVDSMPVSNRFVGYVPRPLSPIFGRETEMSDLNTLLSPASPSAARLITLTGPGGIGKTRLALEVASKLREQFEGRVWFVSFAGITDAETIAPTLASALRLPCLPDVDPQDQIRDALFGASALLVLDNLEQITATGGARFIYELLLDLPHLACLVTSRIQLDVDGEMEYPIPPLPVPPVTDEETEIGGKESLHASPLEHLMSCPSIHMFAERARSIRPDFTLTPRNATAVAKLMTHLEGIPLAVELAAAWVQIMTPAQMLARLTTGGGTEEATTTARASEARFGLLVTERRSLPARHRSLRSVMEESLCLLPASVRRHFATLSLFRGSWDLSAAEAVCASVAAATSAGTHRQEKSEEVPVAEAIRMLRHHSLLRHEETTTPDAEPRFRLLETVREFAFSTLSDLQQQAAIRAHARFFAARAEQCRDTDRWYAGSSFNRANDNALSPHYLEADRENLNAAICGALSSEDEKGTAVRLVVSIWPLWYSWGMAPVGVRLMEKVLTAVKDEPTMPALLLAEIYFGLGRLHSVLGAATSAIDSFSSCLTQCDGLHENVYKDSENEQR